MTIIIKQTDYSKDFSKLLSNARIQGIRNVPQTKLETIGLGMLTWIYLTEML